MTLTNTMSAIDCLPTDLIAFLLIEWLDIKDLCRLDRACTNAALRAQYVKCLHMKAIKHFCSIPKSFCRDGGFYGAENWLYPEGREHKSIMHLLDWLVQRNLHTDNVPVYIDLNKESDFLRIKKDTGLSYPAVGKVYVIIEEDSSVLKLVPLVFPRLTDIFIQTGKKEDFNINLLIKHMIDIRPYIEDTLESLSVCFHGFTGLMIANVDQFGSCLINFFLIYLQKYLRYFHGINSNKIIEVLLKYGPQIRYIDVETIEESFWETWHTPLPNITKLSTNHPFPIYKLPLFRQMQQICLSSIDSFDPSSMLVAIIECCKQVERIVLGGFCWERDKSPPYKSYIRMHHPFSLPSEESYGTFQHAMTLLSPVRIIQMELCNTLTSANKLLQAILHSPVNCQAVTKLDLLSSDLEVILKSKKLDSLEEVRCFILPQIFSTSTLFLTILQQCKSIKKVTLHGLNWEKVPCSGPRSTEEQQFSRIDNAYNFIITEKEKVIKMDLWSQFSIHGVNIQILSKPYKNTMAEVEKESYYSLFTMGEKNIMGNAEAEKCLKEALYSIPTIRYLTLYDDHKEQLSIVRSALVQSKHREFYRSKLESVACSLGNELHSMNSNKPIELHTTYTMLMRFFLPFLHYFPTIRRLRLYVMNSSLDSPTLLPLFSHLLYFSGRSPRFKSADYFHFFLQKCKEIEEIRLSGLHWTKKSIEDSIRGETEEQETRKIIFSTLSIDGDFRLVQAKAMESFSSALLLTPPILELSCECSNALPYSSLPSLFSLLQQVTLHHRVQSLCLHTKVWLEVVLPTYSSLFSHVVDLTLYPNRHFGRTIQSTPSLIYGALQKVKKLSLISAQWMRNQDVLRIVKECREIESLELEQSKFVNEEIVTQLHGLNRQWKEIVVKGKEFNYQF